MGLAREGALHVSPQDEDIKFGVSCKCTHPGEGEVKFFLENFYWKE